MSSATSSARQLLEAGLRHQRAGRMREATRAYQRVLEQEPDNPDGLHLLGLIALQQGQLATALRHIRGATQLAPLCPGYHNNLGEVHRAMGEQGAAAASYNRALQLDGDFAEAHNNLGNVYFEQRRFEDAVACYARAIALRSDIAAWHINLGNALMQIDQIERALHSYRVAVQIDPNNVEGCNMLAMALRRQGDLSQAELMLRSALRLRGDYVMAMNNLGIVLKEQGRVSEAEQVLEQALGCRPDFIEAHDTLGITKMAQGQFHQAISCFDSALAINPEYAPSHWNRALTWLAMGDYQRGFQEYEWRFEYDQSLRREFDQPRWDGSPLRGRTILLYAEQGLGDTIQFIRFAQRVAAADGRVVVECQPALARLLKCVAGIDALVEAGSAFANFDVYAPLPSLAHLLDCRLQTVSIAGPYIRADAELEARCQAMLPRVSGLRVGLNWQGNAGFSTDRFRSIPLSCFEPLWQLEGVSIVSLQHGAGMEQLSDLPTGASITDMGRQLDELAATMGPQVEAYRMALAAAAFGSLDLVITSDTMLAHLAGAMGKPVWLIVSAWPDWRWQYERSDNAWYPTMRIFRQQRPGDWASAINQAADSLEQLQYSGVMKAA